MLGPFDEVMQALKQRAGTSVRDTVRFSGPWGKAGDKKVSRNHAPFRKRPDCRFRSGIGWSMARLEMHPRISRHPLRRPRGFTVLEALVAVVILTIVASGAAVGIGLGSAAQADARITQLAMQAADQQMGFLLEQPFDGMSTHAGEEVVGAMLAPPAGGGVSRDTTLGGPWSSLGRRTSVTSEPLTFTQYNGVTVDGARIEIEVFGPDGTIYASLRRHRCRESES